MLYIFVVMCFIYESETVDDRVERKDEIAPHNNFAEELNSLGYNATTGRNICNTYLSVRSLSY